jgi:hypothetical protein
VPDVPYNCLSTLIEKLAESDREGIEGSGGIAPRLRIKGAIPPFPSMPSQSESASFSKVKKIPSTTGSFAPG